ncbi:MULTISPECIES: BatD family protein [unclassified Pseudomonas]|uniref:BatD family protein n=1 Tax=unclassified Pseudomonas TaxID=196821 RepID=UPI000EA98CCD|nr:MULTISPECIES: BatD family protein [unclassified Pseudomonas]AYF86688.1 hypothetical protein D6Z43_05755 [Pseudomonas sp. DY-1]MDH4653586.1 protein BatD [Pseudomonas sp. BN606]
MKRLACLLLLCLSWLVQATEPEVRVQQRLVPAEGAVVGGIVNLEVDLLVDTWFTEAPILPGLDLPGAVVDPPSGEAQHLTEQLDGKTFFGLRFTYQITPQAAQRFDIPALAFQVQPGQASGPVKISGQPLSFVARALAGAGDESRLVARSVKLTQEIQRSHDPLRQGDSITRRLRVEAEGAQAMLIPPPLFAEVKGLKRYVQTPKVQPLSDGRGGTSGGTREDSATYVIGDIGTYSLPAVELKWWDAATGEAQSVSVPAVPLEAAKGAYQAPFSINEDLRALGRKAQVRISGHWLLLAVLLSLLAGLAYFGRPWGHATLTWLRHWRAARQQAWLDSAEYARRLAQQQLKARPVQLGGLYLWVRRSNGSRTLSEFSRALPDRTTNHLLAFLKVHYGAAHAESQAATDASQALPDVGRAVAAMKKTPRARRGLKPLNP